MYQNMQNLRKKKEEELSRRAKEREEKMKAAAKIRLMVQYSHLTQPSESKAMRPR
jgi:hypothetical protein